MGKITSQISISLDGFVAGPNQTIDDPIGVGGLALHQWLFATSAWHAQHGAQAGEPGPDSDVVAELTRDVGAYIMGRNMFGPGRGAWNDDWTGWWGDNPPFHAPVFVLTHHAREPVPMAGGTTFHFVTDGIDAALERARTAAGEQDVHIDGGASTIRQYLAAGLLDELCLHITPVLLSAGERLLDDVGGVSLEQTRAAAGRNVTHLWYRVIHATSSGADGTVRSTSSGS